MLKNENGSQASNQKPGQGPKPSRTYKIKIDGTMYEVQNRSITGRGLLELAKKTPIENFGVAIKLQGQNMKALEMDEVVDLEAPGLEKFVTYHIAHSDGEGPQGPSPFELPKEDSDYACSLGQNLEYVLDSGRHWVLLHNFPVPEVYNVQSVTAAILLPIAYPQCGPDMFYFYPRLSLTSGKSIHAADSTMNIQGKMYQRWSRHFLPNQPWRPGFDNLETYALMIKGWLKRELAR